MNNFNSDYENAVTIVRPKSLRRTIQLLKMRDPFMDWGTETTNLNLDDIDPEVLAAIREEDSRS